MSLTPNLALPLIDAAQAQKHVTHNEGLLALDGLVQLAAAAREPAPPPSPAPGVRYLVDAPAEGLFAGREGQIAAWEDGGWRYLTPRPGWILWLQSEGRLLLFRDGQWSDAPARRAEIFGVGAEPDAANRFAAAGDSASFSAAADDMRVKINKSAAPATAALMFQTGWSGRAELGLLGEEDFSLKVSDGGVWRAALAVDRSTGAARFPAGLEHPLTREPIRGLMFTTGGDGQISIYRNDTPRSAQRQAEIASIAGDVVTLTAPVASLFFHSFMTNVAYLRLWNVSRTPAQPCWVMAAPAATQLQMLDAGALAGWMAGDVLQIGDPFPSVVPTRAFALDISPMLQNVFGQVFAQSGLLLKAGASGVGVRVRLNVSATAALGSFMSMNALSNGQTNESMLVVACQTPSPISAANLVFVREDDAGPGTLATSLLSCMAVLA